MDEPTLDFSKCPICGATKKFEITSDERMYGHASINFSVAADGTLTSASFGVIEAHWDSVQTLYYVAECCADELPEEYQKALDVALDNSREFETPPFTDPQVGE